jgi:hypothetical protein
LHPSSPSAGGASSLPRLPLAAAVVALLALHAALAVGSMWNASPTFDEVSHLPAGLAIVATGEVRLNPQHPPLVKELAGLAASAKDPRLPLDGAAYREGNEWEFGREVLYLAGNDPMALVRAGRLPVVAISLAGALVAFTWSRARFGDRAGLLSLALYSASPTILAHAALVTTDIGVTTGVLATMWLWWHAGRVADATTEESVTGIRSNAWLVPYALAGLALGATLAAKFSALLLPPLMVICDALTRGRRDLRRRFVGLALVLGLAAVVLSLVYLSPTGALRYLHDEGTVYRNARAGYLSYLNGHFATRFPHYFLVATAVKATPIELVSMLGALGVAAVRLRRRWRDDLYLWAPAIAWTVAMTWIALDIGVRYVLPTWALLFVLAGGIVAELARARRFARWTIPILAALALVQASEAVAAFPGFLSYFNRFAGGPAAGVRWLDDSNLDWGQSLYRLPGWLAEHDITHARLLPMAPLLVPLQGEGVTFEPMLDGDWAAPRPGDYVVSAHQLVRGLERGTPYDWLRRYEPADTFDGSMYLYRFPPTGASPASR